MRYLKQPTKKSRDKVTPKEQKTFTGLFEDVPASEIPEGGVAKNENHLLYGSHTRIRPGLAARGPLLPDYTGAVDTFPLPATKSGFVVTVPSLSLTAFHNGMIFVWDDGSYDVIRGVITPTTFLTFTDDTRILSPNGRLRYNIHANIFHTKSRREFILLGFKIWYIDNDFGDAGTNWKEVPNVSLTPTVREKSTFDQQEDDLYLFNTNGMYKITATDTDPIAIKMNVNSAVNTIIPGDIISSPPTEAEETTVNRVGRRYLFSSTRMENAERSLLPERGDPGVKILKESGTNTYPASDDYIDYKEVWGQISPNALKTTGDVLSEGMINGLTMPLSPNAFPFDEWVSASNDSAFNITLQGDAATYTRDVIFNLNGSKNWIEIGEEIQTGLRDTFPEQPYILFYYDTVTHSFIYHAGQSGWNLHTLASPVDTGLSVRDASAAGFLLVSTIYRVNGAKIIGPPETAFPEGRGLYIDVAEVPGADQMTHYSVYSTRNLGPDYRGGHPGDLGITSPQSFILNKDLRAIAVFTGAIIQYPANGAYSLITLTKGNFELSDIGSQLLFPSGAKYYIIEYQSENTVVVRHFAGITITPSDPINFVLGSITLGACDITANVLSNFVSSQGFPTITLGRTIWITDDVYFTVIEDLGSGSWKIDYDAPFPYSGPCSFAPNGRNFNDTASEDALVARETYFPLLQRFWTGLPSGRLGAIAQGFAVIGELFDTRIYYSQFTDATAYLIGAYYAEFQFGLLKDKLVSIKEMPDQIITFCKDSTYRANTNVVKTITEERVGEVISVLSGVTLVGGTIGCSDQNSIAKYGTGKLILITPEPGIRIFDGYKFSENLIMDEDGQGHIRKSMQKMGSQFTAVYEPSLYGYVFWGYEHGKDITPRFLGSDAEIEPDQVFTDVCYRLALEKQQGFGFTKLNGPGWVFPELGSVGHAVVTKPSAGLDGVSMMFIPNPAVGFGVMTTKEIIDVDNNKYWDIIYFDEHKIPLGLISVVEITHKLLFAEDLAPEEHQKLKFLENHFYLRPQNESDKNETGYDEYGFRDAQVITIKAYIDGNAVDTSLISTANPKATVNFPDIVEARRIQLEISGTSSSMLLVGQRTLYTIVDRRVAPANEINQEQYQNSLAQVLFWVTRGSMVDRATGLAATTLGTHNSSDGPDGNPASAIDITSVYSWANRFGNTSRNLIFSIRINSNEATDRNVVEAGNFLVQISGLDLKIGRGDLPGSPEITITLVEDTWYVFRLRAGLKMEADRISSDLELIKVDGPGIGAWVSGSYPINLNGGSLAGVTATSLFDVRMYDGQIDDGAFSALALDIFKRSGFSLLPADV